MRGVLTFASLLTLLSSQGAWAFSLHLPHHRRPESSPFLLASARHYASGPPPLLASTISIDAMATSHDSSTNGQPVTEKGPATATATATTATTAPPPPPPQGPTPGDLDRQTFKVDSWSEGHWKAWVNSGDPAPKLREILREVTEAPASLPARYWLYHLGRA
jgi:hypothetical protein